MDRSIEQRAWLDKARGLATVVEEWREAAERERRLPQPLFQAIQEAGILNLMLPRVWGGHQVSLETEVSVVEELSRQDGSVGWNVMIGSLGGCFADYLPREAARAIFGSGKDVAVGSFAPTGQALPVPGGYRVSGQWAFGSGCHNATWLSGGFLLLEDGKPRMNPDGSPDTQLMLFPRSECEILDTWRTTGMRGTGSHDYRVEDLFIPEDRVFPYAAFFRGPAEREDRGHAQPFHQLVAPAMAAVSLGIARRAIDSFKELATKKTPLAATSSLARQHTTHLRVGEAEALLRSARAYLFDTVRQVDAATNSTKDATERLGADVRLASAYAAQSATNAVDLMFDAAGGSSIYESSRLEGCFRDVHMVTHHIIVAPSNIEMVGQYLLGLGLRMRR